MPSRILVYGVTGAGKSTLARKIAERTGLPWHSVDDLTWDPNWVQVPVEEQRRRIQAICDQDAWILDSAYGTWLDIPLGSVEMIVALDFPRWISLGRLTRRTLVRLVDRRPICNGNRETLRGMFSKDSILVWHFKSFNRKHERIETWSTQSGGPEVVRFRKPREVDAWLTDLRLP